MFPTTVIVVLSVSLVTDSAAASLVSKLKSKTKQQ